jgi:UDP-N-acetylglucosamine 4,6-dehydratase
MKFIDNKSVLITGGTGSFGQAFSEYLIKKSNVRKVIIYSRDEMKQYTMQKKFESKKLRFLIGDVRDYERLKLAFKDVDFVIHAAALKQVPVAEYNPLEFIKTNIYGSSNVVQAAIETNVKKVLAISTDKAVNPINLYGATKLCSEKIFINANSMSGFSTRFSVVRYGNVINSRGSIVPMVKELKLANINTVPLTNEKMTRFFISLDDAVTFVLNCLEKMNKGEIFIPKMPSIKITKLIEAIHPKAKLKNVGLRPGEKIDELLISADESRNACEFSNHFVILPSSSIVSIEQFKKSTKAKLVKPGFVYSSNNNKFLSLEEIKNLISIY